MFLVFECSGIWISTVETLTLTKSFVTSFVFWLMWKWPSFYWVTTDHENNYIWQNKIKQYTIGMELFTSTMVGVIMVCHQKDLIHDFVNIILTSQTPDSEMVGIDNDNDWPLVSQKYPHFSYGNRVTYMLTL